MAEERGGGLEDSEVMLMRLKSRETLTDPAFAPWMETDGSAVGFCEPTPLANCSQLPEEARNRLNCVRTHFCRRLIASGLFPHISISSVSVRVTVIDAGTETSSLFDECDVLDWDRSRDREVRAMAGRPDFLAEGL